MNPVYFYQRLSRRRKEWFMTPSALENAKREIHDQVKEVREVIHPHHKNDNQ